VVRNKIKRISTQNDPPQTDTSLVSSRIPWVLDTIPLHNSSPETSLFKNPFGLFEQYESEIASLRKELRNTEKTNVKLALELEKMNAPYICSDQSLLKLLGRHGKNAVIRKFAINAVIHFC
jgi:hypothetical protein